MRENLRRRVVGVGCAAAAVICASILNGTVPRADGLVGDEIGISAQQSAAGEQSGTPQETFAKKGDVRPAEEVYKNIQVLKGVPAEEVLERMKTFTRALGVRCEFCHVTAEGSKIPGFGAFSKDDLDMKKTARKMIRMVGVIKTQFFDGKASPTCWTCHRGNQKPELEAAVVVTPEIKP